MTESREAYYVPSGSDELSRFERDQKMALFMADISRRLNVLEGIAGNPTMIAAPIIKDLTGSRLTASDGDKKLVSVSDLTAWLVGATNQVTVNDDGDGSATLSLPQDIDTSAVLSLLGTKLQAEAVIGNKTVTAAGKSIFLANPGVADSNAVFSVPADVDDGYGNGTGGALFDATGNVYVVPDLAKRSFFRLTKTSGDDLPQGAIIISAAFHYYVVDDGWLDATFSMNVHANDIDSAVSPVNGTELFALALTTDYDAIALTRVETGWVERSVPTCVQEVLDRPGYTTNNPIMLILNGPSGSGRKNIGGNSAHLEIGFVSSTQTITLESAMIAASPGRAFVVQKHDTSGYRVDITCEGAETINGEATVSIYNPYDSMILIMPDSGSDIIAILVPWIGNLTASRLIQTDANGSPASLTPAATGGTAATFVQGSGNAVNDASTFDGFTLKEIAAALRAAGVLA